MKIRDTMHNSSLQRLSIVETRPQGVDGEAAAHKLPHVLIAIGVRVTMSLHIECHRWLLVVESDRWFLEQFICNTT